MVMMYFRELYFALSRNYFEVFLVLNYLYLCESTCFLSRKSIIHLHRFINGALILKREIAVNSLLYLLYFIS